MDSNIKKVKTINTTNLEDFIGTYNSPNTYTANIPEQYRNKVRIPDPEQRIAHVNPNESYV